MRGESNLLDMSHCGIPLFPSWIKTLPKDVTSINLEGNMLTGFTDEDVEGMGHLEVLNVSSNMLYDIPSGLQTSAQCRVLVSDNPLSGAVLARLESVNESLERRMYEASFLGSVRTGTLCFGLPLHRLKALWMAAEQGCEERACWYHAYGHMLGHASVAIERGSPESHEPLCVWLGKMSFSKAFQEKDSRQLLAKRVCSVLRHMDEDATYRERCLALVVQASETCSDMAFLDGLVSMEVAWLVQNIDMSQEGSDVALAEVALGLYRMECVRKQVASYIQQQGADSEDEDEDEVEEVEMVLYALNKLQPVLQLPIEPVDMSYERVAVAHLEATVLHGFAMRILDKTSTSAKLVAVLCASSLWVEHLARVYPSEYAVYEAEKIRISDRYTDLLMDERVPELFDSEGTRALYDVVSRQRERSLKTVPSPTQKITMEWLAQPGHAERFI
jgi:hypothetical protein